MMREMEDNIATSLIADKNSYWGASGITSYKRRINERNCDWTHDFEYNTFNRAVIARIEESTDNNLQYCIDCNRQVLDECEIQTVKVTIHGPYGGQDNEFIALAEPFDCDQVRPQQIASALVGSKVPIKVHFQYSRSGKTKGKNGYILSLQDVDDDGYLVYYLRKGRLIVERMLPHDFVLLRMDEKSDPSVLKLIEEFLQQDQEENQKDQLGEIPLTSAIALPSSMPLSPSLPSTALSISHSDQILSDSCPPASTATTTAVEGLLSLSVAPEDQITLKPQQEDPPQQWREPEESMNNVAECYDQIVNKDVVFVSIATTSPSNQTTHDSLGSI